MCLYGRGEMGKKPINLKERDAKGDTSENGCIRQKTPNKRDSLSAKVPVITLLVNIVGLSAIRQVS